MQVRHDEGVATHIGRELGLSKNTVADIVHRSRDAIMAFE